MGKFVFQNVFSEKGFPITKEEDTVAGLPLVV
ncbi:MAG: hypothetical protein H6Q19_1057 [Bacteroidetes bacterium]|nr:hypothetical protein [Bacteroidota bacterium]